MATKRTPYADWGADLAGVGEPAVDKPTPEGKQKGEEDEQEEDGETEKSKGEETSQQKTGVAKREEDTISLVQSASPASGETLELSPLDHASGGRATPMIWVYRETLNSEKLVSALQRTLDAYPVLCGRYTSPPTAVLLNNTGVPVQICTMDKPASAAFSHLPTTAPVFFQRSVHEEFVPSKAGMDPDPGTPDVPLQYCTFDQNRTVCSGRHCNQYTVPAPHRRRRRGDWLHEKLEPSIPRPVTRSHASPRPLHRQ